MKKTSRIVFLVLFFFAINSCKQKSQTDKFIITIDAIIHKKDKIQLFYTTDSTIKFNESQTLFKQIIGSDKNQLIKIIFPDTIHPKQLRLDFGRSANPKEIVVNEINFAFKDKHHSAKGEEIYQLFRIDTSNTTLNKLSGGLKAKNSNQKNGPSLYPNGETLFLVLNELYLKKPKN
jgi:hypothetical protein